ncbi:hypothetical protein BS47DRAFT_1353280 [Hydnum rufescens UP504]|uniref:Uncharacterized protein n=1 Tax=Hydnum rufescens UP504 TaxID=1448309 RepID=A0A9P6AI32_9AGAM|nr:hypothetical protein BS47DRAFT_1353280 [Hydnum rufescens UP504]
MPVASRTYMNPSISHQDWTGSWLDDEHILFVEGSAVGLVILAVSLGSGGGHSSKL